MTEADEENGPDSGHDEIRSLVKGAFRGQQEDRVDVLAGVQAKIYDRSGGKFFSDGWSTSRTPPISTYLVTSCVMLLILAARYCVLAPISGEPKRVPTYPAPVRVIPATQ